jgi:hypothetical protein
MLFSEIRKSTDQYSGLSVKVKHGIAGIESLQNKPFQKGGKTVRKATGVARRQRPIPFLPAPYLIDGSVPRAGCAAKHTKADGPQKKLVE